MRTRKQVRNFGLDITNYQQQCKSLTLDSHNTLKIQNQASGSNSYNLQEKRQPNKLKNKNRNSKQRKKTDQQSSIEERLQQIIIFGYRYYYDIMAELTYVSVNQDNLASHIRQTNQLGYVMGQSPKARKVEIHTTKCQSLQTDIQKNKNGVIFPSSPQLTKSMRNILIQWLIQVHHKMGLRYETLYLTIYLVDKFCSRRMVNKSEYQLLGMASLFLAGKYQQVATPKLRKIISLCDRLYDCDDVLHMESQILLELNFRISQPSLNWFLSVQLFSITNNFEDKKGESHKEQQINGKDIIKKHYPLGKNFQNNLQKFKRTCYYVGQLCLFEIQILKHYSPQVISNTVVYTVSMVQQYLHIDVRSNTEYLSPTELRQMRECTPRIKNVFEDRHNKKYESVNFKYKDIFEQSQNKQSALNYSQSGSNNLVQHYNSNMKQQMH